MTTEIISSELDVADGEFFRGRVKSGLKGSETVVLEHVKKGLVDVEMSEWVD